MTHCGPGCGARERDGSRRAIDGILLFSQDRSAAGRPRVGPGPEDRLQGLPRTAAPAALCPKPGQARRPLSSVPFVPDPIPQKCSNPAMRPGRGGNISRKIGIFPAQGSVRGLACEQLTPIIVVRGRRQEAPRRMTTEKEGKPPEAAARTRARVGKTGRREPSEDAGQTPTGQDGQRQGPEQRDATKARRSEAEHRESPDLGGERLRAAKGRRQRHKTP